MQVDFHHAATYVLARLAGFEKRDAEIIAYSSQYVDDAINGGIIRFKNDFMYKRIRSSHPLFSFNNIIPHASRVAWVPFHFLPGNEGKGIERTICRPHSKIACEMVQACIEDKHEDGPYSLHRLGITLHVYADTWAHQDFTGVNIYLNDVHKVEAFDRKTGIRFRYWLKRMARFLGPAIGEIFPLGHGAVLTYPDLPYMMWSYRKPGGKLCRRNNIETFLNAAQHMFSILKNYQTGDQSFTMHKIPYEDFKKLRNLFRSIRDLEGGDRHAKWISHIEKGDFSFGPESVSYVAKGPGSWKEKALQSTAVFDRFWHRFEFDDSFFSSDWKMFHDALQVHRFVVLNKILPKYGICVA